MTRLRLAAVSISLLGASLPVAGAWGQSQPTARLTSRDEIGPPLSSRALPAAPSVHRLSIGPLLAPSEDAVVVPTEPGESVAAALAARADRGDPDANYRLALRYLSGDGVEPDIVEAFARVRVAAEAGHARAISLFYTLGAKLTAAEHAKAYERAKAIRAAGMATIQKLSTGTAAK
ncbi:MAG: sel1 repeat family protein [Rhodospirillaceae bacterium]|nr:sel1 repeat family protein [Rhodospirillaceae bacterium]